MPLLMNRKVTDARQVATIQICMAHN